ncbi:MAG: PrsW family intramembrane metalloprotease, partial [Mogibacterium sp.]|nr:PrsW family intramembrane metalloprotease [Mogibacterium sp.]
MIYAENILICIAVPLIISLGFIHGSARRFTTAFLFGMGVCLLAAYISGFINVASGMGAEDTAIFISPIVEEIMKFLPILFFLFMFMPNDRTLLIIAVGICAGFATFENCCYILSTGVERLTYVLIRGMAVGVMHVVSGLAVSFGLVVARRYNMLTIAGVVGALGLSTTFHALYNLMVS